MRSAPPAVISLLLAFVGGCVNAGGGSDADPPTQTSTGPATAVETPPEPMEPEPEPASEEPAFEPVSDDDLRVLLTTLDPETEISGSHACPKGSNCLVFNGLEFELYDPTTKSATGMSFVHDQLLSSKLPEEEKHARQLRAMRLLLEPVKGRPVSVRCDAAGVMPELVGWSVEDGFVTVEVPKGRPQKSKTKVLTPAEANAETERIAKRLRFDEGHDQMVETYEQFWARLRPFSDEQVAKMTADTMATPTLRVMEDYWAPIENEYFLQVLVLFSPESKLTYLSNASVVGDVETVARRRSRHRTQVDRMLKTAGVETLRFKPEDACWLPRSIGGQWIEATL